MRTDLRRGIWSVLRWVQCRTEIKNWWLINRLLVVHIPLYVIELCLPWIVQNTFDYPRPRNCLPERLNSIIAQLRHIALHGIVIIRCTAYPWAMVIHLTDASLTNGAVVGSLRFDWTTFWAFKKYLTLSQVQWLNHLLGRIPFGDSTLKLKPYLLIRDAIIIPMRYAINLRDRKTLSSGGRKRLGRPAN